MSSPSSEIAYKSKKRKGPSPPSSPPPYASQSYWEERYRKQLKQQQDVVGGSDVSYRTSASDEKDRATADTSGKGEGQDTTTLAYHSWYFTYDELRPIILPLILGGRQECRDILLSNATAADEEDGDDDEAQDTRERKGEEKEVPEKLLEIGTGASDAIQADPAENDSNRRLSEDSDEHDEDEDDGFEEIDDDEEDEETEVEREGLAKLKAISVLEVGCGDVPLGAGIALEMLQLEKVTNADHRNIIKRIVCVDYSQVVVDMMKLQYRSRAAVITSIGNLVQVDIGNVPLQFAKADARQLPYEEESFDLILEKGTLDAMLSDMTNGSSDCVKIVAECARVLTAPGYIVLVSHMNAHTAKGERWLEEVVFKGISSYQQKERPTRNRVEWSVEVHGSDQVIEEEDSEEGEGGDFGSRQVPVQGAGPAVYVIHKKLKEDRDEEPDGNDEKSNPTTSDQQEQQSQSQPTIPVKFYAY